MTRISSVIPALFVFLWATGFIGARYAVPWAEPFSFLTARFWSAFMLLLVMLLVLRTARLSPYQAMHAAIVGVLIHGLYLGAMFWAISNGMPVGLGALIAGLQPLTTAVIAGWALGEKVKPRHWAGLGIGFIGVVIVIAPRIGVALSGVTTATVAACLVSMLAMSVGTIWQKRYLAGTDLVAGTLWQYVGAGLLMIAASLIFETQTFTLTGELVFALAWLVLVLSIGAIFLLMHMIREGEVAKVSSLFYLVPIVTAVMAWALFGESLTPVQIAGMAITTLGVAMATRR